MLSPLEEEAWFNLEDYDAEIPQSVKWGFGFGAGLAMFQVAVVVGAIGLGMLMSKE